MSQMSRFDWSDPLFLDDQLTDITYLKRVGLGVALHIEGLFRCGSEQRTAAPDELEE